MVQEKLNIPPSLEKVPPWFPFWCDDFLSSTKVEVMNPKEVGAYVLLLLHSWKSRDCSLPKDDRVLAKLSRLNGAWSKSKDKILRCFIEQDEKLYNARLLEERWVTINRIEKARDAANTRWNKSREITLKKKCGGNAGAMLTHEKRDTNAMRKQCSTDARDMPPTPTGISISSANSNNISWIASGKIKYSCDVCGDEVVLHDDSSGKVPSVFMCKNCGKIFETIENLEEIE